MGGSNNRFRGRRVVAVLGAVTLSLLGAVGGASSASAAAGTIDFDAEGSILIHKHEHGASGQGKPSGGTLDSPGVAGVRFTAYEITSLPLDDSASWVTLRTLAVPADACDGTPSLAGQTVDTANGSTSSLTNGDGEASIGGLPVAAYLLCETTTPPTVIDKAQPFVVTIPYPNESGTASESWLYDVNVYPKNGVGSVSKTVIPQADLGLGATASFEVTTDIPTIASGANFTHYWVQDPMDSRLTPLSAPLSPVTSVTVGGVGVPTSSGYYTASVSAGNVVTLEFTSSGLAWLKSQGGKKLVTTFAATVDELGNGVFNNNAFFSAATRVGSVPSDPADPVDPSDPEYPGGSQTESVVTQNWGDLAVHKVDFGSRSTGLEGAVFEVYAAQNPYAATCNSTAYTGDPISVNSLDAFPTDENGLLHIEGLFVSDNKNDPGRGATQRCYVLKEIAAPAGFILPEDGTELRAVAVRTGVTNTATAYDDTITNTREDGLVLPMTGSNGIVALSVAGTALIATGLVLAFLARRRRQTA
jgi:fimbrial isopeptide formation D2 family protein/LPXTG-motif cell wall-anchored protein